MNVLYAEKQSRRDPLLTKEQMIFIMNLLTGDGQEHIKLWIAKTGKHICNRI